MGWWERLRHHYAAFWRWLWGWHWPRWVPRPVADTLTIVLTIACIPLAGLALGVFVGVLWIVANGSNHCAASTQSLLSKSKNSRLLSPAWPSM